MIRTITTSFALAFQNIRSNFFHTLLSVLGIVIGVAALVAILSLIDGMEEFAHQQITSTTSLNAIAVESQPYKTVNEVRVRKDSFAILPPDVLNHLALSRPAKAYCYVSTADELLADTNRIGARILLTTINPDTLVAGSLLTEDQFAHGIPAALINVALARTLTSDSSFAPLTGRLLRYQRHTLVIQGVFRQGNGKVPMLIAPLNLMSTAEMRANPPALVVEAQSVEDVPALKKEIDQQLRHQLPGYATDITLHTNDMRIQQAAQGFLLFRVIMGLIVGISVLVGGIGVMNVLLISVTERTAEIGVRKAVGANRSHIILQFLSESITVSAFGSFLGLILGILGTMAFIPIIRAITKVPFQAAYTSNTLVVIAVIALLVGIIFGTYPAIRASRLDPVDAIRHE